MRLSNASRQESSAPSMRPAADSKRGSARLHPALTKALQALQNARPASFRAGRTGLPSQLPSRKTDPPPGNRSGMPQQPLSLHRPAVLLM